jgi:hypothetical protein
VIEEKAISMIARQEEGESLEFAAMHAPTAEISRTLEAIAQQRLNAFYDRFGTVLLVSGNRS